MKAIVLSCDKYHAFAEHMILCYEKLWPDHPFKFHIPYHDTAPVDWACKAPIEAVHAPNEIKQCALALLEACDDEEWVFWSIDDKYPMHINSEAMRAALDYVQSGPPAEVAALCISRSRGLMLDKLIDTGDTISVAPGLEAIKRLRFNQIWYHQFVRAGVLKYMFQSFPDRDFRAKEMDYFIDTLEMPAGRKLYVTQSNNSLYGESTTRGYATENCRKSFRSHGLSLPAHFETTDETILMGQAPFWPRDAAKSVFRKIGLMR